MSIIKKFCKKIVYPLNFILYAISFLMPRKNNRWLFGYSFGFCDNPKYLFLELIQNKDDIEKWWITKNKEEAFFLQSKGINAVYSKSLKGYYLCMTAKVYIYSFHSIDINFFTSGNTFKVNLWHGVVLKDVEWNIRENSSTYNQFDGTLKSRYHYPWNYEKHDLLLVPGPFNFNDFPKMFRVSEDQCVKNMYPRCSIFEKNEKELERYIRLDNEECKELYKTIKAVRRTYIYMPTYRDDNRDFFVQSGVDIETINKILKSRNDLLIIKFHPVTLSKLRELPVLSNVHFINSKLDIYPLLPFTDVLITDYSSIYFDYLLLKKGIILFPFDLDQYLESSRGFSHDYNDVFWGIKCTNVNQLMDIFYNDVDLHFSDEKYEELISRFWYNYSDNTDLIKRILKEVRN